jgi:simple sugar transport system ATP-binding protein
MVHQEFFLIPRFTVTENVMLNREPMKYSVVSEVFGTKLNLIDRNQMKKRTIEALKILEVELDPEMSINKMPVGYKQYTEIAREINRESTKLLVLDEPTAVLTESEASIVIKVLKKLAKMGISIIFISHRLEEIFNVCDKIVVLRDGAVQKELIPSKTNASEVAEYMVGYEIKNNKSESREIRSLNETILEVKDLWVNMPAEQVKGISFKVRRGEIFGIGGLAGQGKLGIANGIMGLFPSEGEVKFKGEPFYLNNTQNALKRGIAFVSEDRRGVGLLLDEAIFLNICFTAMKVKNKFIKPFLGINWINIRDDKAMKDISKEYIEALHINCVSEIQKARELSGGNQQKLCLAKAFILKPELMFVSEPTRGIDVGAKSLVLDRLRNFNRQFGTTIIITSSELEELKMVSDRIAIMSEGKIAGILPFAAQNKDFGLLMLGQNIQKEESIKYNENRN